MASDKNKKKRRGLNMNDKDIDTLITVVESKKGLWNHGHQDYKESKATKDVWWDDVGKVLKCEGIKCFYRWKNLLKDFKKEHSQIPQPRSGDAASHYEPEFKWYNRMRFVVDSVTPRPSSGNFEKLLTKSKSRHGAQGSEEDSSEDDEVGYRNNLADYAALLLPPTQKKTNPRSQPSLRNEGEETVTPKTVAQLEEHEHYMRPVVPRIRHLTDVQNILFRGELSELVIKFAYQEKGLYGEKS